MLEIPLGLRTALESGDCVLFIGAGIGRHLFDESGNPTPDGPSLAKELADYFEIETGGPYDLAKISRVVEIRKGRRELIAFLHKRLANLTPDKDFQWLSTLRWKAIYTTNYDNGIERAYELASDLPQNPVTLTVTSDLVSYNPHFEVPVYHLHGALFSAFEPNIVITEDDYARFKERRRMLFELLKNDFATSPVLYIGYSNRDPNWNMVLAEISSEFYPSKLPRSYRISPDTEPLDIEILREKNIETLSASYGEFREAASVMLSEQKIDSSILRRIEQQVPVELMPAFSKSPAALVRLLTSWTYVNLAPFHEDPNVYSFLRGNEANWALIEGKHYFQRDIEEEVYEDLLDYATSTTEIPRMRIVLGPAGYGVTTLLKILAVKLVKEKAGPVFMLKTGRDFSEGDIEFAVSLFPNTRPFFIINNASDHVSRITNIFHQLKEAHKNSLFLLGEKLNEWRQAHGRLNPKEYLLESLSDPEINRLIDCLDQHSELGVLEPLSRELQVAAIQQKHGKELL
ncbi:MAG: SIR2 family protein, partial [Nitrospirota bacterium]